jgi:hypothetical protein
MRTPSFHQVTVAEGLEPNVWQVSSYFLLADMGCRLLNIRTSRGLTVSDKKIAFNSNDQRHLLSRGTIFTTSA